MQYYTVILLYFTNSTKDNRKQTSFLNWGPICSFEIIGLTWLILFILIESYCPRFQVKSFSALLIETCTTIDYNLRFLNAKYH